MDHRKPRLRALGCLLLLVVAAAALSGCDDAEAATRRKANAVDVLTARAAEAEAEAERLTLRVERLESQMKQLRQTTYVQTGDETFAVQLNAATATVLVFAIVGLVAFLIAKMRFAARRD